MPNTIDSITEWLTKQIKDGQPISPDVYLEAAASINVLLQGEQEKLFDLEQEIAKARNVLLEADESVAYAKSRVEEMDIYKEARKQKAKIDRAIELIKISKIQARTSREIYGTN